ncbi:hypothetical protein J7W08_00090 [Methanococcoides orientis]|uniref:hypothetical protein n=1 Tax=Methanococcoides TaxID=2225 RepID=UPI0010825AE8|nr:MULTISPECIES: hypothetical protein [Methanococcoides]UGV40792.1 hypothetical protein J7W08_00090 [Methanococcoides orientis]
MVEELDEGKLEHLLGHWIEHNESHSKSFNDWIVKLEAAGFEEVAGHIRTAATKMDECTEHLKQAKEVVRK